MKMIMTTTHDDRKLLELAAKAAGREWLSYHLQKGLCCRDDSYGGLIEYYWNPLTDDGDALRLAVKLNLIITLEENYICIEGSYCTYGYDGPEVCESKKDHGDDPYAATRLAIVRAAAAIGESM